MYNIRLNDIIDGHKTDWTNKKLAVNTPMQISKYLGEKEGCPKGVTCTVWQSQK